jgi:hypothetical protein
VHDILGLIPSLRNLLQPVNRLSPELLSRVVQYIPSVDARDAKSIIPLTHVCRYWRESIVSTPGNWTLISSERFGLMRLSLERCKAAPIKLSLSMWRVGKIPGFSDSIVPYIQNTETLHCHNISTPDQLTQTLPNFPQSMPNLRSLSLSGQLVYWNQSIDPFQPLTLPLTHLSLLYFPLYPAFLSLGTLTDLNLHNYRFNLHLDTLLDFLERNHSLQHVSLGIQFAQSSLRSSRRQVAIGNRLRNLSISSTNVLDNNALISSIVLQTGVDLGISLYDKNAGFDDVLSVIYAARLSNLQSPAFMEYHADRRDVRLLGPNGSFSFKRLRGLECPFRRVPSAPSHRSSIVSPHTRRMESDGIPYQSHNISFVVLPRPRDARHRIRNPHIRPPLHCILKPFIIPIPQNSRVLGLYYHRRFHERVGTIRFQPQEHNFCVVTPHRHRQLERKPSKCHLN